MTIVRCGGDSRREGSHPLLNPKHPMHETYTEAWKAATCDDGTIDMTMNVALSLLKDRQAWNSQRGSNDAGEHASKTRPMQQRRR